MTLLSYAHNCIIYNALLNNSNPSDNADIIVLQKLRSITHPEKVLEYYDRAEKVIPKIIEKNGNIPETWDYFYSTYVNGIIALLKDDKNNEAIDKILTMLDSVESEYSA